MKIEDFGNYTARVQSSTILYYSLNALFIFHFIFSIYLDQQDARNIQKKSAGSKDDTACPVGFWCDTQSKKNPKSPLGEADKDCPPGVWGCKRGMNDLGIVLKQDVERVKQDVETMKRREDCPPGVWGCKRGMSDLGKLLKQDIERVKQDVKKMKRREDCPPGVWGCK